MSGLPGLPAGPVLVLGAARAGQSAVAALRQAGVGPIRVWDGDEGPITRARSDAFTADGVDARLGPWSDGFLDDPSAALVVKSPGVPGDAAPVIAALARGIPVIDELDLGVRRSRRELLAVTGTDGKSTTCAFLASVAGEDVPLAGNTEFGEPLSALGPEGGPVVVEVSSYQLEFTRGAFPRLAILTALSEDHLHRHGTIEDYSAAKRRLFREGDRQVPAAVVNVGGPFGGRLAGELRSAGGALATVGSREAADYRVLGVRSSLRSADVRVATPRGEAAFTLRAPGLHTAENALAALAASDLLGVGRERALARLAATPPVPGRWDVVDSEAPVDFVVDFAHTPDAVRRVLTCAREILAGRPGASLRVVLSAGGVTTQEKRGRIGHAAADLADHLTITEGSVGERPQDEIIAAVAEGARRGRASSEVVPDRGEAFHRAVAGAAPGDLLMAVGHGARSVLYTDFAGGGRPFADKVVAREALDARFGAG